ncbi:Y-family DNA polymerase [Virgibacillus alimentarius]|uniref:DNA polymerase V n=1 Tax=Virgibacillus alimentarius TaxID=698769 RepID=A0ABS4S4M1_9BACI|nr:MULTISPECIES: UV damage repair protein UvrX [Virgibacillus]MBP2256440.1 DNA polymerase V [Virgibacillus alimentarius]HLR66385.1 UV damage repair protein UvrX [Virgibacillus sp.]
MHPQIDSRTLKNKNILCVDMKSFYASCAALARGLDPLTTRLAVVADLNRRGSVVLAATPALKRDFGIRTGSRLFEIPDHETIIKVSAQMNLYLEVSTEVTRLFNKYVPKEAIHTYSIDESFLEVDGTNKLWGSAEKVAVLILSELKDTFGLTAAIGIGPNMLIAKLCLDLEAKKLGIARWDYEDIPKKLWPISPLSQMWGIGSRLEKRLNRMGITTIGQLANYSLKRLEKTFGVMGNQLYYHANGIDLSELGAPILHGQISYGKSQILLRDYHQPKDIACVILEMCEEVGKRARSDHKAGRTIHLGIGYSKNEGGGGFHRSITLENPTNITMEIFHACMHLFHTFYTQKTVRKISISLATICSDEYIQLSLFEKNRTVKRKLGYVMDTIRDKYGKDALLHAVSYTEAGTALKRSKLVGGHYAK